MTEPGIQLRMAAQSMLSGSSDLVARIEAIGSNLTQALDVIVPAQALDGYDISLAPGLYNVQLFLPSGRVLQQACEVAKGLLPVIFHETLKLGEFSLQESSGVASLSELLDSAVAARLPGAEPKRVVPVSRPKKAKSTSPVAARASTRSRAGRIGVTDSARGLAKTGRVGAGGTAKLLATPTAIRPPRAFASGRVQASALPLKLCVTAIGAIDGEASWARLAEGPTAWAKHEKEWSSPVADASRAGAAIWRLPPDVAGDELGGGRVWAVIHTPRATELVTVPAPWRCARGQNLSPIDVLVDSTVGGRAATSVAIYDKALDGLLSYLDRGRLTALRPMIRAIEEEGLIEQTINDKMGNPLAACAAAYVGLALFEPGEQERWDSWLPNIMNRFPWLPDGGIVHARRIMLRPKNSDESPEALHALRQAFQAGIPYYSGGLQLMREMLELLAPEYDEARTMLGTVAPIAARVDPKQTFTILRFPKKAV